MYIYDVIAVILIGISHVTLYLYFIRYQRLNFSKIVLLSIIFSILLGFVVTITRYPEFNFMMLFLFLLCLGLMKVNLTFMHNLYFTLASIVSISLLKFIMLEIGMALFMWSPFNLYLWTGSIIHCIVSTIILFTVIILRNSIKSFATYIIQSRIYYFSFILFVIGSILLVILTSPNTYFLSVLSERYTYISYNAAIILFLILFMIVLISSHLAKEKLLGEQQEHLDRELLDYVKKLEVLHDELAIFRHDYTNILLSLDEAIRTKNITQVEKIYENVIEPTSAIINNSELEIHKLSNIHIPEIKSLLSVKLISAQQNKLQLMIDIPKPITNIKISLVKFIRIISILVDNGIEEAVESSNRKLQIAFFEVKSELYFIVRNSSDRKVINLEDIYEKGFSNKSDDRGYGLYALKQMIDQTSNLILETSIDNDLFTQTIIIRYDR